MASVGRPSQFNAGAEASILRDVRRGATVKEAAKWAGITARTLHRWREQHPEFGERYERALRQMYAEVDLIGSRKRLRELEGLPPMRETRDDEYVCETSMDELAFYRHQEARRLRRLGQDEPLAA